VQIIDSALARRASEGSPIQVAIVGAGFMSQGLCNQIASSVPGMDVAVVVARRPQQARDALVYAGHTDIRNVETTAELDAAIAAGVPAVTDDHTVVCGSAAIDAMVEATGAVEYGARVTTDFISAGIHIILMNAELDGTVGSILRAKADAAGVIVSGCDGDQPGVQANLIRFVTSIGLTPLVSGNIKGLQDRFRNPTTQEGFAAQWGQNVYMVTSFADGTKVSFEQAIVANGYGMSVSKRGMNGLDWTDHIDQATSLYDIDELRSSGPIVDYVVGAKPGPGIYVFAAHDDPKQQHYLNLYKLGEGPLYSFYTPYHLCHFEVPFSVARAVIFNDPVLQPDGGPKVDVITMAKTALAAGATLDRLGGYSTYGEAENHSVQQAERLLPQGLAEGCVLVNDVAVDQAITYDDIIVPEGRLADELRTEQDALFG
jgi:predicted homoserine dehydrogenase-like protein